MPDDIVGGCPSIVKLKKLLPELAHARSVLVVSGAAGTGKTLLALHVHALRSAAPEAARSLNFAVLPERDQRIGLLGGGPPELVTTRRSILELPTTVILKHVECANPYLQEALALALERNEVTRPGSSRASSCSARIIITFGDAPGVLLRQGRISQSLYSALAHSRTIAIPRLRDRREDIPRLFEYFVKKYSPRADHRRRVFAEDLAGTEHLATMQWTENVRSLKIYVRSLLIFPRVPARFQAERYEVTKMLTMLEEGEEFHLRHILSRLEIGLVRQAVDLCRGNMSKAAALLGLSDRAVRRFIGGR